MGNVKEAFYYVKQDINILKKEFNNLKFEINEIKENLIEVCEIIKVINEKNQKDLFFNNPTKIFIDSTHPPYLSTDKSSFKALKPQNSSISTGNEGASTDRQTDRQTDRKPNRFG